MRTVTLLQIAGTAVVMLLSGCVAHPHIVVDTPYCPPPVVVYPVPAPRPPQVIYVPAPAPVIYRPAPVVTGTWTCYTPPAMPALPCEIVPNRIRAGYVWCHGYYRWNGARYVYEPGKLAAWPGYRAKFAGGHWAQRGSGYVWIEARFERC